MPLARECSRTPPRAARRPPNAAGLVAGATHVKAKARYRLIVRKGSHTPALANPDRVDHVEVVDVDDGEVVFYWDLAAADAKRVARALREDLDRLEAREFFEAWASFEGGEDLHRS